ncbi:MAG: CAP domain-containing protein [Bacteroidales bacterium]|jgi:uncharacterized protein YkwD|nr:CAP domain-containing protein [Bacteroidales bacterium]
MKRILLIIISLVSLQFQNFAQKIDYQNIDYGYLEQQIKIGIDGLREEKGLPPLANDSILFLAAQHHAEYLLETDNTGHYQPENPEMRTPHQRIVFYGGNFPGTAENVAQTYLFTPVGEKELPEEHVVLTDYRDAANHLVQGWKNSEGHYQNIIDPGFNSTGVSVSYNPKTLALYAVQTFGKTEKPIPAPQDELPVFTGDPLSHKQFPAPQPHRRHAWKIKSGEKIKDARHFDLFVKRLQPRDIQLEIANDSVIIRFTSPRKLRNLFRHKKDGLALEFVALNDYLNDSIYYTKPSRRNGACIFNGTVPPPLYKQTLNREIRSHLRKRTKDFLAINFGKVPEKFLNDSLYEINLILLKKNKIHHIIPFYHFEKGLCYYDLHMDTLPYRFRIREVEPDFKPNYDTLVRKVYFERNETGIPDSMVQQIQRQIGNKEYEPFLGIITAYASVEGPEDHNKKLYRQRAENIRNIVKEAYPDSFPLYVHTKENWDLFKRQLHGTKYQFLTDSPAAFVKRFLQFDQPMADLDSRLKQQRYVNLYLVSREILTEEKKTEMAYQQYLRIYEKNEARISSGSYYISPKDKEQLSDLSHYLYSKIIKDEFPLFIMHLLPKTFTYKDGTSKDQYKELLYDWYKYLITYETEGDLSKKYYLLKELVDEKDPGLVPTLNYFILTIDKRYREQIKGVDYINTGNLKILKKKLDAIQPEDSIPMVYEMKLYYHFSVLHTHYFENPYADFSRFKKSLEFIYDHVRDTALHEQGRYQVARFLTFFNQYDYALDILSDLYKTTENQEIIRAYLVLYYSMGNNPFTNSARYLLECAARLDSEEWCKLFTGKTRINFQLLDNEFIRDIYCRECGCE